MYNYVYQVLTTYFTDYSQNRTRVLVILSSGGGGADPTQLLAQLKQYGVHVYVVAQQTSAPNPQQIAMASSGSSKQYLLTASKYNYKAEAIASALIKNILGVPGYTCVAAGAGNVMTFDGLNYQVPNTGAFYLFQGGYTGIEVQGLFGACYGQASVSCLQAISYRDNANNVLYIFYSLPGTKNMQIYSSSTGQTFSPDDVLQSPDNALLLFQYNTADGSKSVKVGGNLLKVGPLGLTLVLAPGIGSFNSSTGLCGNFNACMDDDIAPQNDVSAANVFVDANRVPNALIAFDKTRFTVPAVNLPTSGSAFSEYGTESSSCSGLPTALQNACNNDVSATSAAGISGDYNVVYYEQCLSYCATGVMSLASMQASDCTRMCPTQLISSALSLPNIVSNDSTINSAPYNARYLSQSINDSLLHIVEPVAGTYCLNMTSTDLFQRTFVSTQYLSIGCEESAANPLQLQYTNTTVTMGVNNAGYSNVVQLTTNVDDPSRVRKMLWVPVSYPVMPTLLYNTGYTPRLLVTVPGVYVLKWIVYDGCNAISQNVSVTVQCPSVPPRMMPKGFISTFDTIISGGENSGTAYPLRTATVNLMSLDNSISMYNFTLDLSQLAPGLVVDTSVSQWIYISYPAVTVPLNSSTMLGNVSTVVAGQTPLIQGPGIFNQLTKETVYNAVSNITNVTTSVNTPVTYTMFNYTTAAKPVCNIQVQDGLHGDTTARFRFKFIDQIPGGCVGMYGLNVNMSNVCYWSQDYVPFEVSCGPKPVAVIDQCGNSNGQNCNLDEVTSLTPGASSLAGFSRVVNFNYTTLSFPTVQMFAGETFDRYTPTRTMTYGWSYNGSLVAGGYTGGVQPNNSPFTLPVVGAGDYTVNYTVTAGNCASDVSSVKVRMACPIQCSNSITSLGGNSLVVPATLTLNSGADINTCPNMTSFSYYLVSYPPEYLWYLNRITILPPPMTSGSTLPVSSLTFSPTFGGAYVVGSSVTDGCLTSAATIKLTVTCPQPLTPIGISSSTGSFTVTSDSFDAFPTTVVFSPLLNPQATQSLNYLWYVYPVGSTIGTPVSSSTLPLASIQKGKYTVTMVIYDTCQIANATVTLNVVCTPPTVVPQLSVVNVPGNTRANVSWSPVDSSTVNYNPVWQVVDPQGLVIPYTATSTGISLSTFTLPGTYTVTMNLTNACGSYTTATQRIAITAPYIVTPRTAFVGAITAVQSSTDSGFPQVNFDANTTNLVNIAYSALQSASYWYVLSAPSNSVLLPAKTFVVASSTSNSTTTPLTTSSTAYNSTSVITKAYFVNTTSQQTVTQTILTKLKSSCPSTSLSRAGMFSVCFRPDVAGTYSFALRIVGNYSEVYEMPTPVTVTATCGANLVYSSLVNSGATLTAGGGILSLGTGLTMPQRFTVDARQIFTSTSNIVNYGMVFYATQNYATNVYDAVSNTTSVQYLPNSIMIGASAQYLINNGSRTVSFIVNTNVTQWLLELTSSTGCQYSSFNTSLQLAVADASPFYSSIVPHGGARYVSNTTLGDGTQVMQFAYSPDKRVGMELFVKAQAAIPLTGYNIAFGTCVYPAQPLQLGSQTALSAGAIAGIVIGAVVFLGLVGAGAFICMRRMKK